MRYRRKERTSVHHGIQVSIHWIYDIVLNTNLVELKYWHHFPWAEKNAPGRITKSIGGNCVAYE